MLSERADDALIGSVLGKDYVVLERIGAGGMAVVYLVEHQTLKKRFAAKVLSQALAANLEARARFTQEAHAASALDHDNIVDISDFGVTPDGRPYFVMELLRGRSLERRLAEGPMTMEELVAVAVSVGRALSFAHAEGIVHRDIKPENVFLVQRSQGRWGVKVVDFGIAKAPVNDRITKMGEVLGTPMYMSPEACRGDDVDHRADIYSFGILLYQMLCGRAPFEDGNLLRLLQMQLTEPLPPPRSVNPDLSPGLAAILECALEKEPSARYPDMESLLAAFAAELPPGADRLLVEMQTGVIAGRATPLPFPVVSAGDSRPSLPRVQAVSGMQPTVQATATPTPTPTPTPNPTPNPTPTRRRPLTFAIAAVAAVVAGGAIAAVVVLSWGDAPATPTAAASPAAATTGSAPAAGAPDAPKPSPPPPAPATVKLRVDSQPSGAVVKLDGRTLGETPFEGNLDKLDRIAHLVVTKPGHDDIEREVNLEVGASLDLILPAAHVVIPTVKRPPPPRDRDKNRGNPNAGSGTKHGDPNLDIRLTR
ncbi:MAG: protein kinase [Deltaproteobacteria bacterium]|nr:protein kinase [Deltaproteobacteria bacterium]